MTTVSLILKLYVVLCVKNHFAAASDARGSGDSQGSKIPRVEGATTVSSGAGPGPGAGSDAVDAASSASPLRMIRGPPQPPPRVVVRNITQLPIDPLLPFLHNRKNYSDATETFRSCLRLSAASKATSSWLPAERVAERIGELPHLLCVMAAYGNTGMVEKLLKKGVSPNAGIPFFSGILTPMHTVLMGPRAPPLKEFGSNHVAVLEALFNAGGKIPIAESAEFLCAAASVSDPAAAQKVVHAFLARGVDPFAEIRHTGTTALHCAAENGHVAIVEELLRVAEQPYGYPDQKAIFVDKQENGGRTPLHAATARNHLSVVELLLTRGANANLRARTFFERSREEEDPFQPRQPPLWAGFTPLHLAAKNSDMKNSSVLLIEKLLQFGANPNARVAGTDWTPGPFGSASGSAVAVFGAKRGGVRGQTALHLAARFNGAAAVEKLLKGGAKKAVEAIFTVDGFRLEEGEGEEAGRRLTPLDFAKSRLEKLLARLASSAAASVEEDKGTEEAEIADLEQTVKLLAADH